MKNQNFVLFLTLLFAGAFIACQRVDSTTPTKSIQAKPALSKAEKEKLAKEKLEKEKAEADKKKSEKTTAGEKPEDKESPVSVEDKIKVVIKILGESHNIFNEVWSAIWTHPEAQGPKLDYTVFNLLRGYIKSEYGDDGKKLSQAEKCELIAYELKTIVDVEKNDKKTTVFELNKKSCSSNQTSKIAMFSLRTMEDKTSILKMRIVPSDLKDGVGQALAADNKVINCEFKLNGKVIESMDCKNLGQNFDKELHILIETFVYGKGNDKENLVTAHFRYFKNLVQVYPDERPRSIVVPVNGDIVIQPIGELPKKVEPVKPPADPQSPSQPGENAIR